MCEPVYRQANEGLERRRAELVAALDRRRAAPSPRLRRLYVRRVVVAWLGGAATLAAATLTVGAHIGRPVHGWIPPMLGVAAASGLVVALIVGRKARLLRDELASSSKDVAADVSRLENVGLDDLLRERIDRWEVPSMGLALVASAVWSPLLLLWSLLLLFTAGESCMRGPTLEGVTQTVLTHGWIPMLVLAALSWRFACKLRRLFMLSIPPDNGLDPFHAALAAGLSGLAMGAVPGLRWGSSIAAVIIAGVLAVIVAPPLFFAARKRLAAERAILGLPG